jgi:hypothetical protein
MMNHWSPVEQYSYELIKRQEKRCDMQDNISQS